MHELDKIDRHILNELQSDATISLKTLAERVHSSVQPASAAFKRLRKKG